ncbi:MAG: toll/interleukin-1 receptor domain-containing protein [Phenylobacterium sp.]|uniref:toll/interleukin-1 receptor domain-containing protein n=1 Tax=Phenylobacterium sp. TaxID=1871053 RepID=UPI00273348FC|nr:toll/interleukin-1 receptor domain-containing protein [Phenylobacterium sp.]MDP3747662.1 toll/interleukin-1 receptor domain-containing protein [Phenylobacterium sp.]
MIGEANVPKTIATDEVLVFVSYCHKDAKAREQFDIHCAQLKREGVRFWFDGDMIAGAEIDPDIRRALRTADVFVALASPDYLHSTYCFEREYGQALRKAKRGKVHVVVALIKQCQWRHTRMAHYKLLPRDAKPVAQWVPRGDAYENIVEGLRDVVQAVRNARAGVKNAAPAVGAASAKHVARPRVKASAAPAKPKKPAPVRVKPRVAKKPAPKKALTARPRSKTRAKAPRRPGK